MTNPNLSAQRGRLGRTARWTVPLAVAGVLAAQALPASATEASAGRSAQQVDQSVPGGFASWEELFAFQRSMNATVRHIERLAGLEKTSGYAGAVAAPEKRRVEIFWKGQVPSPVSEFIASSRIPVDLGPAPYSRTELEEAAKPVMEQMGRSAAAGRVTEVAIPANGTGLQVQVAGSLAGGKGVRAATAAASSDRPQALAEVKVPVEVEVVPDPAQTLSRSDEQAFAGAYMRNSPGSFGAGTCSTAFTTGNGNALTARHCFPDPNRTTVYNSAGGAFADLASGPVTHRSTTVDVATVKSSDGSFFKPAMWRGATSLIGDGRGQWTTPVTHAESPVQGNIVSTSGAMSGERGSIQVKSKVQQYEAKDSYGNSRQYGPAWNAKQLNGGVAAGSGDSGGPVFSFNSEGVTAVGIISAGDQKVTCPEGGGRFCGSVVKFVDIGDASALLEEGILIQKPNGLAALVWPAVALSGEVLPYNGGHEELMAMNGGFEADLDGGRTEPGTKVQAARGEAENPNNEWVFWDKGNGWWQIETALGGGMVIDHNPNTNRTHLIHAQEGNPNQLWAFQDAGDGWSLLVNAAGGCLTADREGEGLGVWACDRNNSGQKWRVG
ncbi:RICIN domain-containing protein [Kitasatospora sp. NPDC057940]|uniref:RICIN domain-containing protein n=1 Tax=Kitasatospora sp. NPDC057940 TaxID=3346285 RepID=UPI0036D76DA5